MKISSLKPNQNITQEDINVMPKDVFESMGGDFSRITDLDTATAILKKDGETFSVVDTIVYADISTVQNTRDLFDGEGEAPQIPLDSIEIGDVFTDQCTMQETSIAVIGERILLLTDLTRKRAVATFDLGNGWEIVAKTVTLP